MKKVNAKLLMIIAFAVVVVLAFTAVNSITGVDYSKAYNKTEKLKSYQLGITTIVTIEDGDDVKQSIIDQNVNVYKKGSPDMRYEVKTTATSTEMETGKVVTEENSYLFYDNKYYYTYPGVKYINPTEYDGALSNINNLTDVISFAPQQMIGTVSEKTDKGEEYTFIVDYEATSAFVQATLQSAAGMFEGETLSPEDIEASATVKRGYVNERELYVVYSNGSDKSITLEIYTSLIDRKGNVMIPDDSEYANIYE